MVLEIKVPHGENLASLQPLLPVFFSYVLSFFFIAIYWNNHHHMCIRCIVSAPGIVGQSASLVLVVAVPVVTGWMGENNFAPMPTALYGVVSLMAGIAYAILTRVIIAAEGEGSLLAKAVARFKGNASMLSYLAAIPLAFVSQWISLGSTWWWADVADSRSSH